MKRILTTALAAVAFVMMSAQDRFPDNSIVGRWFSQSMCLSDAPRYVITDFGVKQDSLLLQTNAIQRVIDRAAENGGGVVVIPKGTFL